MDYALAKRLCTKHRSALTRAKNSKDPKRVIAACDAFFNDFHENNLPYPDDWRIWGNAKEDAQYELRRIEAGLR